MTRTALAACLFFVLGSLAVLSQSIPGPAAASPTEGAEIRLQAFRSGSSVMLIQSGPIRLPADSKQRAALSAAGPGTDPVEAFASYGMVTNGFTTQKEFDANFAQFSEDAHEFGTDDNEGGLGPSFNGPSCVACHPNGDGSAQRELRCGHMDGSVFVAPPGGTLVRLLSTVPEAQQRVPDGFELIAERLTTTLRGLAFLEFVRDGDILAIQAAQPVGMRGTVITVPVSVFAADGTFTTVNRIGRFGHKCQQGTLVDFAADADKNEKGRTSILQPTKAPAIDGRSLLQFVRSTGLDDPPVLPDAPMGSDIRAYSRFMRALPAPPRNFVLAATPDALAGERLFSAVQCNICHIPMLQTAPAGMAINGFPSGVPAPLGGLTFHPFTDCMVHPVNGDGIVQGSCPADMTRTAPLWGLGKRASFMHDGASKTLQDAIQRHGGQAAASRAAFNQLTPDQRRQVLVFLSSL